MSIYNYDDLARSDWRKGDYVRLRLKSGKIKFFVYVVASDNPGFCNNKFHCWTVVIHENDWTRVGKRVSTKFVNEHSPELLHRVDR